MIIYGGGIHKVSFNCKVKIIPSIQLIEENNIIDIPVLLQKVIRKSCITGAAKLPLLIWTINFTKNNM